MARFISKSTPWIAALIPALAVAGCCSPESTSEKFETIPLGSIYSNSGQKGLQHKLLGDIDSPNLDLFVRFLHLLPQASNLFIGIAKELNEAIEIGLRFDARSEVALPKQGDKSQVWLIVFMGFHSSSPCQWNIKSVQYNHSKIRVSFSTASPAIQRTRDSYPYFYWIPLPKIMAGKYDLELRDSATKEIVLSRNVLIKESKR